MAQFQPSQQLRWRGSSSGGAPVAQQQRQQVQEPPHLPSTSPPAPSGPLPGRSTTPRAQHTRRASPPQPSATTFRVETHEHDPNLVQITAVLPRGSVFGLIAALTDWSRSRSWTLQQQQPEAQLEAAAPAASPAAAAASAAPAPALQPQLPAVPPVASVTAATGAPSEAAPSEPLPEGEWLCSMRWCINKDAHMHRIVPHMWSSMLLLRWPQFTRTPRLWRACLATFVARSYATP